MSLTRRDALRLAAAAAATPLLPRPSSAEPLAATAPAAAAGRFFSAPEMALLDELTEMILPADEHSGGARAAGVVAYIDGRLAEYDPEIPPRRAERERWKAGLAVVDALAKQTSGKTFLECSPEERLAVLERLAAREKEFPIEELETKRSETQGPETVGATFFVELKAWTVRGYYTSKVGIHDELEYKGNTLLMEFVGTDPATLPPLRPPGD